jgi:transcriptional regulator with XRE-family HTH domain
MTDTNRTDLADEFRQLLETLMVERGLSANRVGQMAGVADTTISRILRRERVPGLDLVDRILDALGYDATIEVERHWRHDEQA